MRTNSSLSGPAFHRALLAQKGRGVEKLVEQVSLLHTATILSVSITRIFFQKYIDDLDAVREILMGLQGRRNLMFLWRNTGKDPFTFQVSIIRGEMSFY